MTPSAAQQPRLSHDYTEKLMRRIVPLIALLTSALVLLMIRDLIVHNLDMLRKEHSNALDRINLALTTQLQTLGTQAELLSNDRNVRNYLQVGGDIRTATEKARDFIAQNPSEVLAVRTLDPSGKLRLEVLNVRGFPQITIESQLLLRQEQPIADPYAFAEAVNAVRQRVFVGDFKLLRDNRGNVVTPPRAILTLYVPVFSTANAVLGVQQVTLDVGDTLNIINRAEASFINPLPNRHVLLLAGDALVVADSNAQTLDYLVQLERADGNLDVDAVYRAVAPFASGATVNTLLELNGRRIVSGRTFTIPLLENFAWRTFIVDDLFTLFSGSIVSALGLGSLAILISIGSSLLLRLLLQPVVRPLEVVSSVVTGLAQGERVVPPPLDAPVVASAREVARQLEEMNRHYSEQVARRNRDLRVVSLIGHETATLENEDVLLKRAINLICNEMGYYHAQVFLVDELNNVMRLAYSRGEAGQHMLAYGHKIAIGSRSVIGATAAQRRPIVINDTENQTGEVRHAFNPLLPETRAEMGLPLMVGERLLGALDIQSRYPNAFLDEEMPTFELLANQIAIALYNAQLRQQSERRIQQIDRLNRQLTRAAWEDLVEDVSLQPMYGTPVDNAADKATAPITIRGEEIGVLEAGVDAGELSENERLILESVAERMALALENARLFQETQVSLAETSTLYQLSRQFTEAETLSQVLEAVLSAVAPDADGGQLWLMDDAIGGSSSDVIHLLAVASWTGGESTPVGTRMRLSRLKLAQHITKDMVSILHDVLNDPRVDDSIREEFIRIGAKTAVFIPLILRNAWKGFIEILYANKPEFNEREMRIYNALISQAGVAIENRLLFQQTEEALSRNEKLYAASRLINTARNLSDLVYAAVATAPSPELNFWLGLLEGEADATGWRDQVRFVARSLAGAVIEMNETRALPIPQSSAMRLREPDIINSKDSNNALSTELLQWLVESEQNYVAIFPLYVDNMPIGLFFVSSEGNYELTDDDFDVYKAITGQMSTQIQNRRLLARTEAALNETTRLYVASRALSSVQNLDALYETMVGHIAQPFVQSSSGTPSHIVITVLLAQPQPRINAPELQYAFQWSSRGGVDPRKLVGTRLDHVSVPLGTWLLESEDNVLLFKNVAQMFSDDPAARAILTQGDTNAVLVVPLQVRTRWFGTLLVNTDTPEILSESYTRFLQAISDQVAVVLENQALLQATISERAYLRDVLSTLPAGVLVLDPTTLLPTQTNERFLELMQLRSAPDKPFSAAAYNLYRTGTNLLYPDSELPALVALHERHAAFADDLTFHGSGNRVDLLMNAAPIYDQQGNLTAIVAAFQDITNLRGLENTLQENLRETVTLYETQRLLSEATSQDTLLDTLIAQLGVQEFNEAYLFLTQDPDNTVVLARALNTPLADVDALLPLFTQEPHHSANIAADRKLPTSVRRALAAFGAQQLLVVPLRTKTRPVPIGWMMVLSAAREIYDADQERIITTIADMAATALDNIYLVESTQLALRETAALYSATTAINRARDFGELADALRRALAPLEADMVAAYLLLDEQVVCLFAQGFEQAQANGLDLEALVRVNLQPEDSVYIADTARRALGDFEQHLLKCNGMVGTFAAVNLRIKDVPSGRIFVGYRQDTPFSERQARFLGALADSASVVVDNMVLLEQIQNTLQETSVLYQASRALIEANTPADIVDVMVNYLIEPHITSVLLALLNRPRWDDAGAELDIVAHWRVDEELPNFEGIKLTPRDFPAWELMKTESVLPIEDTQLTDYDNDIKVSFVAFDARSLVIIPLRVASRAIGVIWVSSNQPSTFRERDLRVFQAFAEQTSLSLEAARLLRQAERRAQQLKTTTEISERIGNILDLDVLLPQVVDLIRERFGYDHAQVFLMDDKNEYAVLKASTGKAGQQLLSVNHKLQRGSFSVIGRTTELGQVTIALDTTDANVVHKPNRYLPMTRSEMAIPLVIKGKVVGALDVQSNQPNAFSEDDIQALTTLAAQISVAIDNARLYEESIRRANEMGFLFDVTTATAAAETLEQALQAVTDRLKESLEPIVAAIYLPQTYESYKGTKRHVVKPTALASNTRQPLSEVSEVEIGDAENLLGIVSSTLQPQIVYNVEREVRYNPIAPNAKSAIAVPITSGASLIALLVLEDDKVNAFDSNTLTLLLTLSGSVAAIIQNTQLLERLQRTNEQLREVDRLKSQFLANMSHELRTPLNSIIGFSRVLLKGIGGPLTEMQEQDLTTIYNSGNHLLNLINDILDQAKIEAKELTIKPQLFDLKATIETVKSMAVGLLKDSPLQFKVEVAPNLPQAYGDEFRTRQIMLNLVSNAIKFTPQGSVTVRVYPFVNERGATMIRVDVIDTGIGIAEKDMPILFEQFRQVDSSLTRTVGGTGLGLPISKALAELQGGELLVTSELGVGSTFSVTIPTQAADSPPQVAKSKGDQQELTSENDTTVLKRSQLQQAMRATNEMPAMPLKREVLLIEDNKDMVDQCRRILQREGFEVQTADHPAYAEAMVSQIRPTVVVMDVNFANGEGWNILARLKAREDTQDIPIVVNTLSSERERVMALGAHGFVQRPFMPDDLVKTVREAEKESNRERILIIDDQPEAIRLLKQLLSEGGDYRVFAANNGVEGISMIAQRRPSLVILDLRMPDMDGFAVLNELRNNPETAQIPVLVVTGDIDLNSTEQEQLQNVRVVPKADITPEEYTRFLKDVKAHLGKS